MKNPGAVESRRLVGLLEAALVREARLWKVPVFKNGCIQGADISSSQHQEVILWLGEMNRLFHFCPETFALGVCVLHRLLSTVKAQPKYLKCIAFTSLVLAAKINEEDEVIGSVQDLVVQSGCNFSTAEILRMERIILDKLHWDLYTATAVDFIHIVDSAEFIHCKEMVDEYLHSLEFSLPANAVYILDSAQIQDEERACSPTHRHERRRSSRDQGDSDEYYDGFRCLYNEEATPGAQINDTEGSQQKNVSPCPPLHPAIN
ncbi:cyclin-I [Epinephelus lanceolatus]